MRRHCEIFPRNQEDEYVERSNAKGVRGRHAIGSSTGRVVFGSADV